MRGIGGVMKRWGRLLIGREVEGMHGSWREARVVLVCGGEDANVCASCMCCGEYGMRDLCISICTIPSAPTVPATWAFLSGTPGTRAIPRDQTVPPPHRKSPLWQKYSPSTFNPKYRPRHATAGTRYVRALLDVSRHSRGWWGV